MVINPIQTHVAYRCPECGTIIYGYVGKFALKAGMLRIKCSCGKHAIDVTMTNDGKVRLSVPCIFCKQNHNFVVSQSIFFGRELFLLNCPYSNMDICFIGDKEKTDKELERTGKEIEELLEALEIESHREFQPEELDEEEVLTDPTVYDSIRFLMKELEYDGNLDCPCHAGPYELRYCREGLQIYCENCGASHTFDTRAESASAEYLEIDKLVLS